MIIRKIILAIAIFAGMAGFANAASWPVKTTWQWQLTGTVNTSVQAQVFDIDGFDNSASVVNTLHSQGKRVICYISAGSWEDWRPDAGDFPPETIGGNYPGWPGEKLLNVSNPELLRPVMTARFQMCKNKGFDAIEPDNTDQTSNAYTIMLAGIAHGIGIDVGLKNDVGNLDTLEPHFDFAVNEECFQYNECGEYSSTFLKNNKAVFNAEYPIDNNVSCATANALGLSTIKKNLNLGADVVSCIPYGPFTPLPPVDNPPVVIPPVVIPPVIPPVVIPPPSYEPPVVKPVKNVTWRFTCRGKVVRFTIGGIQRVVPCTPGVRKVKYYTVVKPTVLIRYRVIIT